MRRAALVLCLLAVPLSVQAQTDAAPQKPDVILVHEEIVQPGAVGRYEAATKDLLAAMTEKKIDSPLLNITSIMTDDLHYLYVVNLGTTANLAAFQDAWTKMMNTVGADRWRSLELRSAASMASYNEFLAVRRYDLSYVPATPRLAVADARYVRYQYYYLIPGKEQEAEVIAKDYAALFRNKKIGDGFSIYMATMGSDLPLLVAVSRGRSRADYETNDEKTAAALGDDVKPLQARALAITRKYETRDGVFRPDLSYPVK